MKSAKERHLLFNTELQGELKKMKSTKKKVTYTKVQLKSIVKLIEKEKKKRDKFWHKHIRNLSKYETENVLKAKKEELERIVDILIKNGQIRAVSLLKQKHEGK